MGSYGTGKDILILLTYIKVTLVILAKSNIEDRRTKGIAARNYKCGVI
jgi:hypothetical protein